MRLWIRSVAGAGPFRTGSAPGVDRGGCPGGGSSRSKFALAASKRIWMVANVIKQKAMVSTSVSDDRKTHYDNTCFLWRRVVEVSNLLPDSFDSCVAELVVCLEYCAMCFELARFGEIGFDEKRHRA